MTPAHVLAAARLADDLRAIQTMTDYQMLLATAGLPLHGEVNKTRLMATVKQCGDGTGRECESCQAILEVLAVTP
jgi:hypothetical protein